MEWLLMRSTQSKNRLQTALHIYMPMSTSTTIINKGQLLPYTWLEVVKMGEGVNPCSSTLLSINWFLEP